MVRFVYLWKASLFLHVNRQCRAVYSVDGRSGGWTDCSVWPWTCGNASPLEAWSVHHICLVILLLSVIVLWSRSFAASDVTTLWQDRNVYIIYNNEPFQHYAPLSRLIIGSCLSQIYYRCSAACVSHIISYCGVRDNALMPTGRNAGYRKRQYVAAMPTRTIRL